MTTTRPQHLTFQYVNLSMSELTMLGKHKTSHMQQNKLFASVRLQMGVRMSSTIPHKIIYFEDSIPTLSRIVTNAMYTSVLLTNTQTRKRLSPYPHLSVSQKQDISDSTIQCFIARTLCCNSVQYFSQGSSEHGLPQR